MGFTEKTVKLAINISNKSPTYFVSNIGQQYRSSRKLSKNTSSHYYAHTAIFMLCCPQVANHFTDA